jgi:hypothetical protein
VFTWNAVAKFFLVTTPSNKVVADVKNAAISRQQKQCATMLNLQRRLCEAQALNHSRTIQVQNQNGVAYIWNVDKRFLPLWVESDKEKADASNVAPRTADFKAG